MKRSSPLHFLPSFLIACVFTILSLPTIAQTPHIDSLLNVVKTLKEDTLKIQTYREICKAYMMELNDIAKVMEYASKTLELAEPIHYKKGIGYGMFYKGVAYWSKGNYEEALDHYKKALVLMKELGIRKGENACYINIGLINSDRGNYPEALEYLKKGIKLNEEANDKQGMQIGYDNIGNVYMYQGNYTQALNYHFKALKIAEERKDELVISYAYNNIGDVFYAQNKLDIALLYYKKSIKYLEKVKDLAGVGSCYTDIGNVYWRKKQYEEALFYHSKDLTFKESLNDKQGTAIAYGKIGFDYFAQHKLKQALYYQLKSYDLSRQIDYKKGTLEASGGIGNVYEAQNDYPKALINYTRMLTQAKALDYKEGIRDAYFNLASVYGALTQFDQALHFTKLYNTAKDSLLNVENSKQVNELNTRYETGKKEKEILLLTKDRELNTKIIKQQQLLRWGLIGGLGLLSISIFSIYRRYRFKQKAHLILEKQKEEIEQKNTLITDSIEYAKTIQEAVMPAKKMSNLLNDSFVFYKPKQVVSGDFYWIHKTPERMICAVADCTGHGVPGAFMSLLGYNILENAVKTSPQDNPASILNTLQAQLQQKLLRNRSKEKARHGINIALISIDNATNTLSYAGANLPLCIIRNHELIELQADAIRIGEQQQTDERFHTTSIQLEEGDMLYLFTDGFSVQLNNQGQPFGDQPFRELLCTLALLNAVEQKEYISAAFHQWMDTTVQNDDFLILGMRMHSTFHSTIPFANNSSSYI